MSVLLDDDVAEEYCAQCGEGIGRRRYTYGDAMFCTARCRRRYVQEIDDPYNERYSRFY